MNYYKSSCRRAGTAFTLSSPWVLICMCRTKLVSAVWCPGGIIYNCEILHSSWDDMGSLSINSIDRNMYLHSYRSLTAEELFQGKSNGSLFSAAREHAEITVSDWRKAGDKNIYCIHWKDNPAVWWSKFRSGCFITFVFLIASLCVKGDVVEGGVKRIVKVYQIT